MKYTDLSTLKIHKLSQEQYERELAAGNINENEIYLTPDDYTSGDADLSNVAMKYTVEVAGGDTVWTVLSAAKNLGANFSEWTLVNTTGYTQAILGIIYQPFGNGSFGLLKVSNLLTLHTAAEVSDWSTVVFTDFLDSDMFKAPSPNYDQINDEGAFLRIVGGKPTWDTIAFAEDHTF